MFDVADVFAVELDLADFDVSPFAGLDVSEEVDRAAFGIAVKFQVDRQIAVGSGFDFELCRKLRHRFAEAVFQMDRPFLVFADADGAARIGLVQCFLEFFRIGTLEIAEVRHLIAS